MNLLRCWVGLGIIVSSGVAHALPPLPVEVGLAGTSAVCSSHNFNYPSLAYRVEAVRARLDGENVVFTATLRFFSCEFSSSGEPYWEARNGRADYSYWYPSGDGEVQVILFYDRTKGQFPEMGMSNMNYSAHARAELPAPSSELVHEVTLQLPVASIRSSEEPGVGQARFYALDKPMEIMAPWGVNVGQTPPAAPAEWLIRLDLMPINSQGELKTSLSFR